MLFTESPKGCAPDADIFADGPEHKGPGPKWQGQSGMRKCNSEEKPIFIEDFSIFYVCLDLIRDKPFIISPFKRN